MVLCRYADEQGNNCFPSTAEIARCSHFAVLPVRKAIAGLELSGWITSRQEAGKKRFFTVNAQKIRESLPLANQDGGINQHPRIDQYGGTNQDGGINQHLDPVSIDTPTPYQSIPRKEHIKEQEKDREETAPASNPESGTCDVTASDLCPSVDAFALSSETPKAAEKPKRGKKAKEPATSIQKPEGVPQEDWDAYKKLRKDKRMPLTQRALEKLQREADKAGKTLAEVIVICLENSWASFGADWKVPGQTANNECTGLIPDRSRNQFYFPDGGRPNRKTTEVPEDYDATAEASDLVGRMLG